MFQGGKNPKTQKNRCHPYIVIATAITDNEARLKQSCIVGAQVETTGRRLSINLRYESRDVDGLMTLKCYFAKKYGN